jgi:putative salt-induced outer membrane protein YdiY
MNNLRIDGDLVVTAAANRYTVNAVVVHAEERVAETARNWNVAARYDHFASSRLFFNANVILTYDRFRDLDLRTAGSLGIGYQALNTPRVTLTADGGLGYVNENLEAQPDDSYTAVKESGPLAVFLVPDRLQIFHHHDGYFGVAGDDNFFITMQNGVRFGLAAGFVTTLRHDLDYDGAPALERRSTDRAFSLTLGYRF